MMKIRSRNFFMVKLKYSIKLKKGHASLDIRKTISKPLIKHNKFKKLSIILKTTQLQIDTHFNIIYFHFITLCKLENI